MSVNPVACFLVGGPSQRPAVAMAHDIADAKSAPLTALAAVDPYGPETSSCLQDFWRSVFTNINPNAMRGSARIAIEEFERQNSERRIAARRVTLRSDWASLRAATAEHDLAVVPAWVGIDGVRVTVENELALATVRKTRVPVLRIASTPLNVRSVLFVVDSGPRHCGLARGFVRLGLWPESQIFIVPVGPTGSSVAEIGSEHRDFLKTHGFNAAVLPSLDLGSGTAKLEELVSQFRVAVMPHLTSWDRLFSSVRSNAFRIVAARAAAVVLL